MCAHCDKAERDYGAGSELANAVHSFNHPPTADEIASHYRAMAELVSYLNAADDAERERE